MKSSRASKKFTLGCSALLVFSLLLVGAPRVSFASPFSLFEAGKSLFGFGKAATSVLGGACYKGGGSPGPLPGIAIPMPPGIATCSGGVNAVGIPIPDCRVPGAACVAPTGCLNLICAAYKNAIYFPGDATRPPMCGCSEPDIQSAAKGVISNFLGF